MKGAGSENLGRQKAALRQSAEGMDRLRRMGLLGGSIDRLHLGFKQPYQSRKDGLEIRNALSFPLISRTAEPLGRYAYLNLPDVTENPQHPKGWGPGPSAEYRLGDGERIAVVAGDVFDVWLAWQCYGREDEGVAFLSRSHWGGWPAEWRSPGHWRKFEQVILLDGDGAKDFLCEIAPLFARDILGFDAPAPFSSFADMVRSSAPPAWSDFLASAAPLTLRHEADGEGKISVELGIFEAAAVDVSGGFAQALKSGYKRSSARKPVADRGGRVRMVDFFGPKMISRTRLPTPVLGSRMIAIHSSRMPNDYRLQTTKLDEEDLDRLRDELHCWAMHAAADLRAASKHLPTTFDGRWEEITRPLRAIADRSDPDFRSRVDRYLNARQSRSPFELDCQDAG